MNVPSLVEGPTERDAVNCSCRQGSPTRSPCSRYPHTDCSSSSPSGTHGGVSISHFGEITQCFYSIGLWQFRCLNQLPASSGHIGTSRRRQKVPRCHLRAPVLALSSTLASKSCSTTRCTTPRHLASHFLPKHSVFPHVFLLSYLHIHPYCVALNHQCILGMRVSPTDSDQSINQSIIF